MPSVQQPVLLAQSLSQSLPALYAQLKGVQGAALCRARACGPCTHVSAVVLRAKLCEVTEV